jgi:hypothetical protein
VLKAKEPIFVTLSGIVILFNLEHLSNVLGSIFTIPTGIFIFSTPEHPAKAPSPILFKLSGVCYDV